MIDPNWAADEMELRDQMLAELRAEIERARATCNDLASENAHLHHQTNSLGGEVLMLRKDSEYWRQQSGEHADQIAQLVNEVTELQNKLAFAVRTGEMLDADLDKLQAEVAALRAALRRIAIYDDADCRLDSDDKTQIARDVLR